MIKALKTIGWRHLSVIVVLMILLGVCNVKTHAQGMPGTIIVPVPSACSNNSGTTITLGCGDITQTAKFVTYRIIPAFDCGTATALFDQYASGCLWPRVEITANPTNLGTIGFMVVIAYRDSPENFGNGKMTLLITMDKNGVFRIIQPLGSKEIVSMTVVELLPTRFEVVPIQ